MLIPALTTADNSTPLQAQRTTKRFRPIQCEYHSHVDGDKPHNITQQLQLNCANLWCPPAPPIPPNLFIKTSVAAKININTD
eukprot:768378-Amphidinium_carterae.1